MHKMSLREKCICSTTTNGSVESVKWKPETLRVMYLPSRAITRIPNPIWDILEIPLETFEGLIGDLDVRVLFKVHVPPYANAVQEDIAARIQSTVYDEFDDTDEYATGAIRSIMTKLSRNSPQLCIDGELTTISNYSSTFSEAVRFTRWSILPVEVLQLQVNWDSNNPKEDRLIELTIDLLFDQRKINERCKLFVNRNGLLYLDINIWSMRFDRTRIVDAEIPVLDPLKTPPYTTTISSDEESSEPPNKKPRTYDFLIISSDEE